jgi:hypothetical protein
MVKREWADQSVSIQAVQIFHRIAPLFCHRGKADNAVIKEQPGIVGIVIHESVDDGIVYLCAGNVKAARHRYFIRLSVAVWIPGLKSIQYITQIFGCLRDIDI